MKINKPSIFPEDISGAIKKFELNKRKHWFYTNEKGETLFLIYRVELSKPDKLGRTKVVYPGCYINGKWYLKLGWSQDSKWKRPPYRLHELVKTTKPIVIVEGEKAADAAQRFLPDYFVTTFYGGCGNWHKTDWSFLKDRDVYLWPDIDKFNDKGLREFKNLSYSLSKDGCSSKMVRVPSFEEIVSWFAGRGLTYPKTSWDLADPWWPGLDPKEFIKEESYVVDDSSVEIQDYTSIQQDRRDDRYVYLKHGDQYFDMYHQVFYKPLTLNKMYKRDIELKLSKPPITADEFLQETGVKYVDKVTFKPGQPSLFEEEGISYLNKYSVPDVNPLSEDPDEDISIFRNHILKVICDGDHEAAAVIEDAIAWDLRNVGGNRKWWIILASEEGLGKDLFFKALKKLYGTKNCEDLQLEDLTERFRPWFVEACYLFLGEVDDTVVKNKKLKGAIKRLISDEDFRIEVYKGVDSLRINTSFTLWGSSNEAIPIRTTSNQRRNYMVDSAVLPRDILAKDPFYYNKLAEFIADTYSIDCLFHYYRWQHKISKKFTEHRCPVSENLAEIIEASQGEFIRYIDRLAEEKTDEIKSLRFDLVNVKHLTQEIQEYARDDDAWGGKHLKIDYNKVLRWVKRRPNKPVKHQAHRLPLIISKDQKEGRLWVVKHHQQWEEYIKQGGSILDDCIDQHFNGQLDFSFLEKHEQKKRKEAY